ncbi:hypothetical protein EJ04DRAFT_511302 [Polyplosphaeria fusca]|uniref:Uncharacterized protein n=1 Tax=Polyplosphaeria fusca TaxID=682080 RepID=A0A9P4R3B2_9PLEO|nr:hypothetical protein EJ04DRAFT_511302 [Polyplosphaeria fusca]
MMTIEKRDPTAALPYAHFILPSICLLHPHILLFVRPFHPTSILTARVTDSYTHTQPTHSSSTTDMTPRGDPTSASRRADRKKIAP